MRQAAFEHKPGTSRLLYFLLQAPTGETQLGSSASGIHGTAGAEKDATGVRIDEARGEEAMPGVGKPVTGDRRSRVKLGRGVARVEKGAAAVGKSVAGVGKGMTGVGKVMTGVRMGMPGLGRGAARVRQGSIGVGQDATVQQKWEHVDLPQDKA